MVNLAVPVKLYGRENVGAVGVAGAGQLGNDLQLGTVSED